MNDEPGRKLYVLPWLLALLASPLLYLAIMPWVAVALQDMGFRNPPKAFEIFAVPYVWLMENTSAQPCLKHYAEWCDQFITRRPAP
jgi:hypothetical protein